MSEENSFPLQSPDQADTGLVAPSPKQNGPLLQIDIMKSWMILLVLMDHSFTHAFLGRFGSIFWERISIPLFFVIMGFNMYSSFERKGITDLRRLYSKEYFITKLERYIIPYMVLYLIQGVIRLVVNTAPIPTHSNAPYDLMEYMWYGYTPIYGPGLWFLPVLFGTITLFPLLYWCFKKQSWVTLFICIAVEFGMNYLSGTIYAEAYEYMYQNLHLWPDVYPRTQFFWGSHVFSHLSGIAMGMWIAKDPDLFSRHNIIIWVFFFIGLAYVVAYFYTHYFMSRVLMQQFWRMLHLEWLRGDYHFFTYGYAAGIVMTMLKILPAQPEIEGKFERLVRRISKSTYHILLAQILYFSLVYNFWLHMYDVTGQFVNVFDDSPLNYVWFYPLSVVITFTAGIWWQERENRFFELKGHGVLNRVVYLGLMFLSGTFFILRLVAQYMFLLTHFP